MSRSRIVLASMALALVAASEQGRGQAPEPTVVHVVAARFAFTPSEIRVPEGTPVELRITREDTAHGFRLLGREVNVEIPKRNRGDVRVKLDAMEPGRYTFECSHVCGAGHSFMRGTLHVVAREAR